MARRCRACCGAGGWPGGAAAGGPKPVVPPRAGWGEVGGTRRCQDPDLAPTLVRPPPLRRAAGHVAAARGRLPCGDARHLSAGSPPGSDARAGAATGQPDRPPGSGRGPVSAVFSPPTPPLLGQLRLPLRGSCSTSSGGASSSASLPGSSPSSACSSAAARQERNGNTEAVQDHFTAASRSGRRAGFVRQRADSELIRGLASFDRRSPVGCWR